MPVDNYLSSVAKLERWMYELHNKVNGKLRGQGLLKTPNPKFECIQKSNQYIYEKAMKERTIPGIDFIYIIAFHYRNTTIQKKKAKYEKFFRYLARIIHLKDIRVCLEKNMKKHDLSGAKSVYCWWDSIYKKCDLNCNVCMKKCRDRCFANVSGCKKKNHRGKTCRKLRNVGKTSTRKKGSRF